MAVFEKWYDTDLQKPLNVETLDSVFFTGDESANLIGVRVFDGNSEVTLSGTIYGYIIRSDNQTVTVTGTLSGNEASIVLPASAYYHEGALDVVIKVDSGQVVTTIFAGHGRVHRSSSNSYVDIDPDVPIPSLLEILQKIEDCENATAAANQAADALENMDATVTGLPAGSSPAVSVSTVDDHYRVAFSLPAGATGATGATPDISIGTVTTLSEGSDATASMTGTPEAPVLNLGIPVGATGNTGPQGVPGPSGANAIISDTAVAYQVSSSGSVVPVGTWSDSIPVVPQGSYLWIRTVLTWNNGAQTILYSISRNGVDGSGSVASVNGYSPDGSGDVQLPYDVLPTQGGQNPITSGGVYGALQGKQDTLVFDQLPASASTNPVTSGGVYSALTYKVDKAGDTITGVLKMPNPEIYDTNYPQLRFKETANTNPDALVYFDRSQGARRFSFKQFASAGDSYGEVFTLPPTTGTLAADVSVDIMTSKGGTMTGTLNASHARIYDASYPMLAFISSVSDTSALGAIYEDLTLRRLAFRQRSTSGYTEDYYLPPNTATANTQYSIATSKQLIGTLTTVWTDAVNNAMLDITVLFIPSDHGDYMFYITIPKGLLTTAYRWFFGSQVLWSSASNITYYYQVNATATAIRYQSFYRDGVDITNGATIRYIYR